MRTLKINETRECMSFCEIDIKLYELLKEYKSKTNENYR